MVEVVVALPNVVPSACNIIMICRWAECSLEVVGWVVGLLGLGAGVGRRSVGWVVALLDLGAGVGR